MTDCSLCMTAFVYVIHFKTVLSCVNIVRAQTIYVTKIVKIQIYARSRQRSMI